MNATELESGPELDTLMAEKVMKWKLHSKAKWLEDATPGTPYYDSPGGPIRMGEDWSPSGNMTDAWEVVEKLNRDGLLVAVVGSHDDNLNACMIIQGMAASHSARDIFLHLDGYDELHKDYPDIFEKPIRVQAETVQLAICAAALEFDKSL